MSNTVIVILFIIAFLIAIILAVIDGLKYTTTDMDRDASNYAQVIRESKGPVTNFLWVSYAAILIFTVVYLINHWDEFVKAFGG